MQMFDQFSYHNYGGVGGTGGVRFGMVWYGIKSSLWNVQIYVATPI